jgi:hypothetical protein
MMRRDKRGLKAGLGVPPVEFASIDSMAGGTHKIRESGAHLPLSQWQGPAISFMAADVNPVMYLPLIRDSLSHVSKSEAHLEMGPPSHPIARDCDL